MIDELAWIEVFVRETVVPLAPGYEKQISGLAPNCAPPEVASHHSHASIPCLE